MFVPLDQAFEVLINRFGGMEAAEKEFNDNPEVLTTVKTSDFFSRYLVLFFCGSWFFFIFFCVGRSPVVKDVDKNETTAVRRELTSVTQFLRSIKNSIRPSAWKNCDSLA